MDFAEQFQDPATGGIFMTRERTGAGDPQLLFPTAQFGMSAVMTGRLDIARSTGEWFVAACGTRNRSCQTASTPSGPAMDC